MDHPNAFIQHPNQPTPSEIDTALGKTAPLWHDLVQAISSTLGTPEPVWQSISPKYGWALRIKLKKRTIVYLGPCSGCFRVSLVLGDRAVQAARALVLPKAVVQALDEAPRYAEGTGLRLLVKRTSDLPAILKLVQVKLAN